MLVTLKWMPYLHTNKILALLTSSPYYRGAGGRHLSSSLHYREMFTVTGELCILCSHYVSAIAVTGVFNLVWTIRMICHIANSNCILTLVGRKTILKLILLVFSSCSLPGSILNIRFNIYHVFVEYIFQSDKVTS